MDRKRTNIGGAWKKYGLFALSLLLAIFVWFIHNMSLDYSVFLQYKVNLETDLVCHAASAVSDETLLIRGKGRGFYIAQQRTADKAAVLDVATDAKNLTSEGGDVYRVAVSDIREKISESIGPAFEIEYIGTDSLTFTFPSRYYKRVPIVAQSFVYCRPQWMQVGEIALTPDSVDVYGGREALDAVDRVMTGVISLNNADKSHKGIVKLKVPENTTISVPEAIYDIRIERYVEMSRDVELKVEHLPAGKSMVLLPSRVRVTYRTSFGAQKAQSNDFVVAVDYNDFVASDTKKMIPRYISSRTDVFSCEMDPPVVEGILTDAVRRK
jgi:hypothetical protein